MSGAFRLLSGALATSFLCPPKGSQSGMSSGIWPSMCCNGKGAEGGCLRFGSASNQVQRLLEAKCGLVCALLQSPSSSASMQQLPTPFARQGSGATEQTMGPAPPAATGATPRRDDGLGAFSRAASMPAAALARSASGTHDDTLRLGEASHYHFALEIHAQLKGSNEHRALRPVCMA